MQCMNYIGMPQVILQPPLAIACKTVSARLALTGMKASGSSQLQGW